MDPCGSMWIHILFDNLSAPAVNISGEKLKCFLRYCKGLLIIRFFKKKRFELPSSNRISKFRFWMLKQITFELRVRFELKKNLF